MDVDVGRDGRTVSFDQPGGRFTAIAFLLLGVLYLTTVLGFGRTSGWERALAGVFLVLAVVSAVPQWRAGIDVDATQLQGRLPLGRRNRRVRWADVDHFELRGYWRGLGARTISGTWVPLMIYGGFSGQAIQIAHELETYRLQQEALVDKRHGTPKVRPNSR